MRRHVVEVVVLLLDVFAVIAFVVVEPVEALFENRIGPVPKAGAKHRCWLSSQIPKMPSSPQRYARERACSNGKLSQAVPSRL